MSPCDDILAMLLLGGTLGEPEGVHVRTCPHCREDESVVRALASTLAAHVVPDPPTRLGARVLQAARPALATNARRARAVDWALVGRAVGVALLPLPLIVFLDLQIVRGAYALLSMVLPHAFGFYVALNYAALLVFLLASTYAAVPFVAARQARPLPEVRHA